MTSKTLEDILQRVETWPEARQEDAASVLIEMEQQDAHSIGLTDAQEQEAARRLTKSDRKFVTLDEARERVFLRRA